MLTSQVAGAGHVNPFFKWRTFKEESVAKRPRMETPNDEAQNSEEVIQNLRKYEWISTPLEFVVHNQKQFFKNTYHSLDSDLLCTTKSSTESRHNGKSTNGILKNNDKSIKIFGLNLPRKTREFKYWKRKKNQACQQL